jgi:Flp pilus assembly protein CpaB
VQDVLSGKLFTTRGGALVVGGLAAGLAAILLIVYLHQYRNSLESGSQPMTVLVAKSLIPKGTSGTLIGQKDLFQVTSVPRDQLKEGAIVDPTAVKDRIAVADIFPGQQLTGADFSVGTTTALPTRISGAQRAISIPVDTNHGLVGQVSTGDRVDVYVGFNADQGGTSSPVLKLLATNVLVLQAPTGGGGGGVGSTSSGGSSAVLRVTTKQAAKFAFSSDNGHLWLILRPQVDARPTPPDLVTVATLLAGATPLKSGR